MPKNLWGELPATEDMVTPLTIMREQANILRRETKGVLHASISTSPLALGRMRHSFYLVAPLLNDYRHLLFEVEHGINTYPATVSFIVNSSKKRPSVKDQTSFENLLGVILKHPDTKKAVLSLMANSKAVSYTG